MESLLEVFFNYGIVHVYKVGCYGVWGGGGGVMWECVPREYK